ncbi:MAG TPA: hypothetical protein VG937_27700 [Polyangiaceae bacterium]|nr:hypothetical protein [Polyangiaceae bacterium]
MTPLARVRPIGLAVPLAVSCAGPSLRGAVTLENGREASGPGQLLPLDCRDGRGAPAAAPELTVQRVRLDDGQEAVLELRRGYDTVAITNGYDDAYGRVFQYVSDDGHHHKVLHTVRITPGLSGSRLILASAFDVQGSDAEFRGTARKVALECELMPREVPNERAPSATAEPPAG